jgi:uncharacterized protein YbaR (Trm112 family)
VFIELTDHLRCPADHDEAFLVLIPDQVRDRRVETGTLGCLVCRREYRIESGVALLDPAEGPVAAAASAAPVTPDGLVALLGIEGPGGFVGLGGTAARFAPGLAALLPGVHFVAVNPPDDVVASAALSLVRSRRLPLKARTLRGMALGEEMATAAAWQREAARVVLPGLRVVGAGGRPLPGAGIRELAEAGGWWVGSPGG